MIIQLLATWIPALLIALSGVLKLSGNRKILEDRRAVGHVGDGHEVVGADCAQKLAHIGAPAQAAIARPAVRRA